MSKELRKFANAKLTEDQRASAKAIIKQHAPSYLEAKYTIETLLPKGQAAALKKGMKAGKANGLTGAELDVAGLAATNLTEEEKARFIDARDRRNSISTTIHSEIEDLLSQEQKTAMSLAAEIPRLQKGLPKRPAPHVAVFVCPLVGRGRPVTW